ncbi:MAG: gamma-glutamylcyclotransferase [Pseudomonadota bacterium]|nr:gamma-glutamylcyclotransferase [Pseudomonadota bacterium]
MHFRFAYGSNLCPARLARRVREYHPEGIGILRGYVLRFNKIGREGSAKCNVARMDDPANFVMGVIYRLTAAGRSALSLIERLGRGMIVSRCRLWQGVGTLAHIHT